MLVPITSSETSRMSATSWHGVPTGTGAIRAVSTRLEREEQPRRVRRAQVDDDPVARALADPHGLEAAVNGSYSAARASPASSERQPIRLGRLPRCTSRLIT